MNLSRYTVKNIIAPGVELPDEALFDLPERVLQFGTGVLLRGLPDYFIDKANRQGIFNGRIVVVKSTDGGDAAAFDRQDGLYTLCVRGLDAGKKTEENIVCSAISRVLSAKNEWDTILECAHNPLMQVIISNTTEVGIQLVNDDIRKHPPISYPGKLLAFLLERYKAFDGSRKSGMVIIPTELILDNGKKLESIVLEQAHLNGLDDHFIEWLENCNYFCNSLVDRIVPGKPAPAQKTLIEEQLGYTDDLLTMSEVYRLWAIEGDEHVQSVLSFAKGDNGVVIAPDINIFRELKLRLLNGTHTLSCAVAYLSGFATVKEAMDDEVMSAFVADLMKNEIAPAIPYPSVNEQEAAEFSDKVLDRFRNPQIEHQWINISVQYSSKMKMRNIPVLVRYFEVFRAVPEKFATGFAAYLLFMRSVKQQGNQYYASFNGKEYQLQDDHAAYFFEKWQQSPQDFVKEVLQDVVFWGEDLSKLPGFSAAVQEKLQQMMEEGVRATILSLQSKKILA